MRIARRFNAGTVDRIERVPKGRLGLGALSYLNCDFHRMFMHKERCPLSWV